MYNENNRNNNEILMILYNENNRNNNEIRKY